MPTEKIIFDGPSKTNDDLRVAIAGNGFIHCDHRHEVDRIESIAKQLNRPASIGMRLYFPAEDSWERFGFLADRDADPKSNQPDGHHARAVARRIVTSPHLKLGGIHTQIGTNVRDLKKFRTQSEQLAKFVNFLVDSLGVNLSWIDVGGGLAGITPTVREETFQPHSLPSAVDYAAAVVQPLLPALARFSSPPRLIFEPGRTLFNAFGALLVSVVGRRPAGALGIESAILDAGVTSLALAHNYNHPIHVCRGGQAGVPVRLLGPTCMEQDQLQAPPLMPDVAVGDLLVVYGVGDYSMAMASSFTHFRLGIVGWDEGKALQWLRRPETIHHWSRLDELSDPLNDIQ